MFAFIDIFRALALCLYLIGATVCLLALAVIYFYFGRWLLHIPSEDDFDTGSESNATDQSNVYRTWHDDQWNSSWTTSSPWDESETSTVHPFADPVPRRQRSTPNYDQ